MVVRSVDLPLILETLPPGRQVECPVEALADSSQRHHRHLPRSQLDPERQPVQSSQHLDEVRRLLRSELEVRPPSARMLDEGAHTGLSPQGRQVRGVSRHGQRLQPHDVLSRHLQRDSRRREHSYVGRAAPECDHQLAACLDHVLAVVQDDEQLTVGQRGGDLVRTGLPGGSQAQVRHDRLADAVGAVDDGERDDHGLAERG